MKLNYLLIASTLLFWSCKKSEILVPQYDLTVSDGSIIEGNAGENKVIEFEVALDEAVSGSDDIRIEFTTADGTAKSNEDYIIPFFKWDQMPTGTRTKKIQIEIVEDITKESTEEFSIVVSSPSPNVKIVDGTGKGTILNDD